MKEFDGAVTADSNDSVAANNRAVCRMYACNLPGAIQVRDHASTQQSLWAASLGFIPCRGHFLHA